MNTIQLVFSKPYPQKGFLKTYKYFLETFQFRLNFTDNKPQSAELYRNGISEAQIIQNRGLRSTLNVESHSHWPLFNGTWQKRPGELDH